MILNASFTKEFLVHRYLRPLRTSCNVQRSFVCLSLCLFFWFACLLETLRKTTERIDFHENSTTDATVQKEKLIKFWKSSASESGSRIFKRIL